MTKWQEVKLGDVCDFQNGYAFKSREFVTDGNINIVKIKELKNGQVVFTTDTAKVVNSEIYKQYQVSKGDILVALTGDPVSKSNPLSWVGRVSLYNYTSKSLLNQRVAKFKPDGTRLDTIFIYYFFREFENFFNLAQKATGSASQANISTKTLNETIINLPPLDVQKKIAGVLGALDDKIELNNKINANLEQQAQALFKSWFVDFEPFGGTMPKDWKIGKLEDVVDLIMGQSPSGNSYNEKGRGCIFFQGRAEFGFRFPTIKLFTTEPRRMARQNDILMSVRAPVGDVNVAHEDCCIGRGLCAIRSKDNFQSFILYTLWSVQNKLNIFNGEGTVFGSINKDSLNNLEIIVPNSNTIQKFENLCSPMDNLIRKNYEENTRLSALRDVLLPKLMSGEIDVSKVDINKLNAADMLL